MPPAKALKGFLVATPLVFAFIQLKIGWVQITSLILGALGGCKSILKFFMITISLMSGDEV